VKIIRSLIFKYFIVVTRKEICGAYYKETVICLLIMASKQIYQNAFGIENKQY